MQNEEVEEVWRDLPNYERIYQISNLGRVKSKDHFVYYLEGGKKRSRIQIGRFLKLQTSLKGYLQVCISKDGTKLNTGVHILVALSFIPNNENKEQVNHINCIKTDNRVENLEWCTNRENQNHAIKNNLLNPNYGEKHHMAKFTNNQVYEFRELHKKGITCSEIAKSNNISITAMFNILNHKTYIK